MTAKWDDVCGGRQLASRVVVLKVQAMKKCAIAVEGGISPAARGRGQGKQTVKSVVTAQNEVLFR